MATAPAADRPATATSPAEVVTRFEVNAGRAYATLAAATEGTLAQVWIFSVGEHIIFSQPRARIIRELLLGCTDN